MNNELSIVNKKYELLEKDKEEECYITLGNNSVSDNYALRDKRFRIYYISDIHLESQISYKYGADFKNTLHKNDLEKEIKKIVRQIDKNFRKNEYYYHKNFPYIDDICIETDILIIPGDLSSDYDLIKIFFEELRKNYCGVIFYVLGNHEYWNINSIEYVDLEKFLSEQKIILLKNELIVFKNKSQTTRPFCNITIPEFYYKIEKYSLENIINFNNEELSKLTSHSCLNIYGGTGFAPYNKDDFNSKKEIYRNGITESQEIEMNDKFVSGYEKLLNTSFNNKIIILSHMPKEDWSNNSEYNSNWIYMYGHTHKNYFIRSDKLTIIANNQMGEQSKSYSLKYFYLSSKQNIFSNYKDGIYEISKDDYDDYLLCMYNNSYSSKEFKIIMLKKNDIYMFFGYSDKNNLMLLDGYNKRKLLIQDINYYYQNIEEYYNLLLSSVSPFFEKMSIISKAIVKIGGSGIIHGSIIDIDFLNHIFVNPLDGTVVPYVGDSPNNKYVYKNIPMLLKEQTNLYENYLKNKEDFSMLLSLADNQNTENINNLSDTPIFVEDTSYLYLSLRLKKVEHISDKIIRIWMQEWFNKYSKNSQKYIEDMEQKRKNFSLKIGENDFYTVRPDLLEEVHPNKNNNFNPHNVTFLSKKKIWWLGKCGHEWKDTIKNRAKENGVGCPYCENKKVLKGFNDFQTLYPDIAQFWSIENNEKPDEVLVDYNKKILWTNGDRTNIKNFIKNYNNEKELLSKIINHDENIEYSLEKLLFLKNKKNENNKSIIIPCKCKKGHKYNQSLANLNIYYPNCPICKEEENEKLRLLKEKENRKKEKEKNKKLEKDNVALLRPDLLNEWDFKKNTKYSPEKIFSYSSRKVWWKCKEGHSYQEAINYRCNSKSNNCPYCNNQKLLEGYNDLATKAPYLLEEWDYEKNISYDASKLLITSMLKPFWKCKNGHKWRECISTRYKKHQGCPYCSGELEYNDN